MKGRGGQVRAAGHLLRSAPKLLAVAALAGSSLMLVALDASTNPAGAASPPTLYVSQTGSDSGNNCTSSAAPCATLPHVLSEAASGDVIDVAGNVFSSASGATIDTSLTVAQWPGQAPAVLNGLRMGTTVGITAGTVALEGLTIEEGATSAPNTGGGVQVSGGDVTISNSTITDNEETLGPGGGGIGVVGSGVSGELTLVDSTVSGNGGLGIQSGGGIFLNGGSVSIVGSTISGNQAINTNASGGGIASFNSTLSLAATIVAGNTSGSAGAANCYSSASSFTSLGYNLTDDPSGTACGMTQGTDLVNTDPELGALADNGGSTQTMLPPPGSPAAAAIPNPTTLGGTQVCPRTDQRGFSSPDGVSCTIGAVEATAACGAPVVSGTTSTVTCNYVASPQAFTVPANVTSLTISGTGAQGGAATGTAGEGGEASGTVSVSPGDVLGVMVGGQGGSGSTGSSGNGGYGGGGNAGSPSGTTGPGSGGGGGGSFVFDNSDKLVLAAGGGGGGGPEPSNGGAGGGSTGTAATPPLNIHSGKGGTQSGGGPAGTGAGSGTGAEAGSGPATWSSGPSPGTGGAGISSSSGNNPGAGGGGGYFGGGGGSSQFGGGGGSGFLSSSLTDTSSSTGTNSGNGVVTFTYSNAIATSTNLGVSSSSTAFGTTVTLTASVDPSAGPTGMVSFSDTANGETYSLGTETVASGQAQYLGPLPAVGTNAVTATYSGDDNYAGSTSNTANVTVGATNGLLMVTQTALFRSGWCRG